MCKFHKDVARDIATDPVTGVFDTGRYSVALVAMAKFRIEQYMPAMYACDGFVPALMRTDEAKQALDEAGIRKPLAEIKAYRDAHIDALRAAMDETAETFDLSLKGLNIPDRITKDGYQHCAKMKPDPTQNGPFLDEAVVELFEGYDDAGKTWARHDLRVAPVAHRPEFEPIRAATAHFLSQSGVTPILQVMFENSLARIFEESRLNENDPGLETDGCVMCGHGSRAEGFRSVAAPAVPQAAENPLHNIFNARSLASCMGSGALGAVVSHAPCLVAVALSGASGTVMAMTMPPLMLYASPIAAIGISAVADLFHKSRISWPKAAVSGAAGFGLALLAQSFTGHDGGHAHAANTGKSMPSAEICRPSL